MITLAFQAPQFRQLRESLVHPQLESGAILLCVPMKLGDGAWRLIVREAHVATDADYEERTGYSVRLRASFGLPLEKKARANSWSLAYVHTHPGSTQAEFSPVDDDSEAAIGPYAAKRCPGVPHVSLLFSRQAVRARMLGTKTPVRVIEVGADLHVAFDASEPEPLEARFDRQVRAFGAEGQARLSKLTIAVVGLGGTGSLVTQQLAHLGVSSFILVDDDVIESTNLNRVVGARPSDVDRSKKVDVAAAAIAQLSPSAMITRLDANVLDQGIARKVIEADVVFNCTDTHASRHVLNQAAYQYLTPVIDMGTSITVDSQMNVRLAGHAKMLAPGLSCLWCSKHLDGEQVRRELMTDEQRSADPYVQGAATVIQPAVISLNSVVSAVSITMLLSAFAGVPAPPRYLHYDGNRGRMNALTSEPDPECVFCGPNSTRAWGDTYPLPGKRNV